MEPSKSVFEFASALTDEDKWHGGHGEKAGSLVLNAGILSMIYYSGNLRYISSGKNEIIRMIYTAFRDKEWLTMNPVISGEEFEVFKDSFIIKYSCQYISGEINFLAHVTIEGKADNSIIFSFEGEALKSFLKNRIGFCVLHPVEGCAGQSCLITHSNNESEAEMFPQFISPYQPFTDIKSMKWKFSDLDCSLDFYGDIFETEDHRNWTDASFKTYSTPLKTPYPVKLEKGMRISQRIEFKVETKVKDVYKTEQSVLIISVSREKMTKLPAIGIGRSTRLVPLTDSEIQILRELRFDHYRVDLYLFNSDWKNNAEAAISEAGKLGYPLEFALFFDDNYEEQTRKFIICSKNKKTEIALISIFHKSHQSTPESIINKIAPLIKKALPGIRISCGTNANFAQLNRDRPESELYDYLTYSIQPQEHATDNATLTENLQAQEYTVKSAARLADNKGIWVSPVNIQRRFNTNISNFEKPQSHKNMPPQVDTRLMSLFGACWTAGSLKYLCEAGIKGVTFFETAGERGIIQGDLPSRWPDEFQSVKGMIFPVYFVLEYLLKNKSLKVIKSVCSNPLKVDSLILSDGKHIKLILSNYTSFQQQVSIEGCSGDFTIKQLYSDTFVSAVSDINWIEKTTPVTVDPGEYLLLRPFSVSFIDGWLKL